MKLTIGRKIGFGFAVVLITTLVVFSLTFDTLRTGRTINDKINAQYNPSISALEQLKSAVLRSRASVTAWAFHQSREDTKEKMMLVRIINHEFPAIKNGLDSLSIYWSDGERRRKEKIYKELSELLEMYGEVQSTLKDMQSYDDPYARFLMNDFVEEDGLIYEKSDEVLLALNELIEEQRSNTTRDSVVMIGAFDRLEGYLRNMSIALFLFGIIIASITVRSIVRPALRLRQVLLDLSKGKIPEHAIVNTGDEIGEMSKALDQLVRALRRTTEFSREVGRGNFEKSYEPLSDDDELGKALISMRDELLESEMQKLENERILEEKVEERTREVVKQKDKIEKQNQQRKELLENITASIRYAKSLQDAILPSDAFVTSVLPESFIFFKPKDIVSGDFYYISQRRDKALFAAVDCTGHGVPGAFMSLVGHNALSRAVAESRDFDPAAILSSLSKYAARALNRTMDTISGRDGMDIALCVYDRSLGQVQYAGAFCPLYIVRNGTTHIYGPDKIVIGAPDQQELRFQTHTVPLEEGDMIYIFSDGYGDQFGGQAGRKFMRAKFRTFLESISPLSCEAQSNQLAQNLDNWRRSKEQIAEQVDDILVIGVKHLPLLPEANQPTPL